MNISSVNDYSYQSKANVSGFQVSANRAQVNFAGKNFVENVNDYNNHHKARNIALYTTTLLATVVAATVALKKGKVKNILTNGKNSFGKINEECSQKFKNFKKFMQEEIEKYSVQNPKSKNVNKNSVNLQVPSDDLKPPKATSLSDVERNINVRRAGKTLTDPASGIKYEFDKNGYVRYVLDQNNIIIRSISRNEDGICNYTDYIRVDEDRLIRTVTMDKDGFLSSYSDVKYDAEGNIVMNIIYNPKGKVEKFFTYDKNREDVVQTYIVDKNGKVRKQD